MLHIVEDVMVKGIRDLLDDVLIVKRATSKNTWMKLSMSDDGEVCTKFMEMSDSLYHRLFHFLEFLRTRPCTSSTVIAQVTCFA